MPMGVYRWTRERQVWAALRDNLADSPHLHIQRIESPTTGGGQPDVEACYHGVQIWIELKIIRNNRIPLTDRQTHWHTQRANAGGQSFILAWDNARQALLLWQGQHAKLVQSLSLAKPFLVDFPVDYFLCPIDWPQLRHTIFTPTTKGNLHE